MCGHRAERRHGRPRRLPTLKGWLATLTVLTLLVTISPSARAQDVDYDQTYTPQEIFAWWSVRLLGPVGQEFVPQVTRLDIVDLLVLNEDSAAPEPAPVFVRIHRDSIGGALAGTSGTVTVPYRNDLPVRFAFDPPLGMQIGSMYVIELATATTAGNPAISAGPELDLYPPGRAIVQGTPLGTRDMWFRTGAWRVAIQAATWGEVKYRYRDSSRSLKVEAGRASCCAMRRQP